MDANAVSNPKFPLVESVVKNLIKLYLNDVGLLTNILYRFNIKPVIDTQAGINLGAVYETVVAQELKAHGHKLFYFDNRKVGEVDFLVNDYNLMQPLPVEVKSGKDYTTHSALDRFLSVPDYGIDKAIVLGNSREVSSSQNGVTYMPVYYIYVS